MPKASAKQVAGGQAAPPAGGPGRVADDDEVSREAGQNIIELRGATTVCRGELPQRPHSVKMHRMQAPLQRSCSLFALISPTQGKMHALLKVDRNEAMAGVTLAVGHDWVTRKLLWWAVVGNAWSAIGLVGARSCRMEEGRRVRNSPSTESCEVVCASHSASLL